MQQLTAQGDPWDDLFYTAGFHEAKRRKEGGVWRYYYWRGTARCARRGPFVGVRHAPVTGCSRHLYRYLRGGFVARIPYVDPQSDAASAAVQKGFAGLPVKLNIFKLVAHAESNFKPFLRFGGSILAKQALSGKLRELAILRVAKLSHAEYEWVQHVPIAKAVGASDAQIAALDRGAADAPCFDETERLLLRFTDEVVRDVGASDATYRALAAKLPPRELVELVLAIGFYMAVARLMETFEIDMDPPAGDRVMAGIR